MTNNTNFLSAGTEMAELIRLMNWATCSLGSIQSWPESLRTVVNLMLRSKAPRFIIWGPDLILLYNDAYQSILGAKHPTALGKPFKEVWSELWKDVGPLVTRTLAGEPLYFENMPFILHRDEAPAMAWISFSYAPLYDGEFISGVYCELTETTHHVIANQHHLTELRQLQKLFEEAPSMIAVLRGDTHIFESANPSYMQLIGHRDIIGKPLQEALPEIATQGFLEILDDVFATGVAFKGDAVPVLLQREPDGSMEERIVNFVNQPIRDSAGFISGILVQAIDITDTVRTIRALRESDDRIRQLANTIPQLAWMCDKSGAISWYNDRWYEYTGSSPEEMAGLGWQRFHDPAVLPTVIEKWTHSLESGEPFEMVFPLRGQDGHFRPFFTLVAPLKDIDGNIVQWLGTNTDVSTLEKTHQELRKTQEWLADGLVAGRMVVWEWDLSTNQVKYSDNAMDVLGYSSGDASNGWASIHVEDRSVLEFAVERALTECGQFSELTRRIRPLDGETIWVQTHGRVVGDKAGAPQWIRGIMVDVTDRIEAERELSGANQRKDEFLAMLAHELRNPLAPISSAAELLEIASSDEALIRKASEVITRQVTHMTNLVDDLLDVSRVSRGLITLNHDNVNVLAVLDAAVEQVLPILQARNHSLIIHDAAVGPWVKGDHTRLVQVCANLLNNAAKYTPLGGRIELSLGIKESHVIITVSDNGMGIEPALMPYIFELFTQATTTPDRSKGGLGLGLALVKNLIQLHGGSVEAKSPGSGMGSAFKISLPMLIETNTSMTAQLPCGSESAIESLRFLIVDDNVDGVEFLGALLVAKGHDVKITHTGETALAAASTSAFDVFILDIGLPDMDGLRLVKRLKDLEFTKNCIFIALSGYGQSTDMVRSKEAGFDHHLVKPLKVADLSKILTSRFPSVTVGNE